MTAPQESEQPNAPSRQEIEASASPEHAADMEAASASPSGEGLERQLAKAQQQAGELQEALQRERADFLNYRRRVGQEREELGQRARVDVLRTLLPALDDLERALQQAAADRTRVPWVEGFQLVSRKLLALLEKAGVERIGAVGEPFDPRFHEAVAQRPPMRPDEQAGTIGEVVRPGYRLKDQVLRPAQVIVVSSAATPPGGQDTGAASTG